MDDKRKTKSELIHELRSLRRKIKKFESVKQERKREKEAMRREHDLASRIIETSPSGIMLVNCRGRITFANRRTEEVLGLAEDEITGRTYDELACRITDSEGNPLTDQRLPFQQVISTGQPLFDVRHAIERSDGRRTLLSINGAPLFDKSGQMEGVLFSIEDITERKRVEEALRLEKENFRHSLDESPLGVRIVTADGDTLYANRTILDFYGYDSLEELRKTPLRARYTPESYAEFQKRKQQRERDDFSTSEYEISIVRKNGEVLHLQVHRKEVLWNNAKQFLIMYQDITERKRAEEAVAESERKLKTLFEILPVGASILNAQRKIVYVNPALERILDISKESLFKGDYRSRTYLRPDGTLMPAEEFASVRAIKEQRTVHNVETGVVKEDGKVVWTSVSAVPVAFPDWKVVVVTSDITERKRAEEALRKSERRYRDLIDNALVGVYQTTLEGDILLANDALVRLLEYASSEDLASGKVQRVYRDSRDRERLIELVQKNRRVTTFETELLTKTGSVKTVLISATLDEGLISGIIQDITERKWAEGGLRSATHRLQRLSRRLLEVQERERRAIARELHDEIGQILTAAKIDLQVILRSPLSGDLPTRLEDNIAMLDRCLHQVRNLSLDLRPSMLDDLGLVAALRWQLERQAERVGFQACLIAEDLPERFDPDLETTCFRIAQEALTNISRHAQANNVEIELRICQPELLLTIRDDGVGFDVDRALADATHGKSFGILGMQERVALLDGKLEINSEDKRGTIVTVRLPLRLAEKREH
jgi:PAS domain S-box-containing protein